MEVSSNGPGPGLRSGSYRLAVHSVRASRRRRSARLLWIADEDEGGPVVRMRERLVVLWGIRLAFRQRRLERPAFASGNAIDEGSQELLRLTTSQVSQPGLRLGQSVGAF